MNTAASDPGMLAAPTPRPLPRRRPGLLKIGIWPVVLVLYATLIPREARLELGDLVFLPERIALLLVLPYTVKKIVEGALRPTLIDWLILGVAGWILLSMMIHYGLSWGLERGGALVLDSTVGYFVARVMLRDFDDLRRVIILVAPGLLVAAVLMAAESLTHTKIVQPLAEQLFGRLPAFVGGEAVGVSQDLYETRLGLLRGQSVFPHPILGGVYLVSFLCLFVFSGLRGWPRLAGIFAALCGVFSLSSAALLGLALSVVLITFEFARRFFRLANWKNFFLALGGVLIALQFASQNGLINVIVRYLTLNPHTGNYRMLIWQYGTRSVMNHPLFGIGFDAYQRVRWMVTASVDTHWLLMAIRFGVLPALAMLLAVGIVLVKLSLRSSTLPPIDRRFARGVAMSLGGFVLMAFTVNLLGGVLTWFTLLLGAAANFALPSGIGLIARGRAQLRHRHNPATIAPAR